MKSIHDSKDNVDCECIITEDDGGWLDKLMSTPFIPLDYEYHELLDPRYADEDNSLPEMPYFPLETPDEVKPLPNDNPSWDNIDKKGTIFEC